MCNYCHLKRIRERAKRDGATVHIQDNNVFVVPKGGKLNTSVDARGNHGKQFVMWGMEFSYRCVC